MLNDVASLGVEQEDYRALGRLMVRLMERGTSMVDPSAVILKNPNAWNKGITGFLSKTTHLSGESLLKVCKCHD